MIKSVDIQGHFTLLRWMFMHVFRFWNSSLLMLATYFSSYKPFITICLVYCYHINTVWEIVESHSVNKMFERWFTFCKYWHWLRKWQNNDFQIYFHFFLYNMLNSMTLKMDFSCHVWSTRYKRNLVAMVQNCKKIFFNQKLIGCNGNLGILRVFFKPLI